MKKQTIPREALRRLEVWLDAELELGKIEAIELNRRTEYERRL